MAFFTFAIECFTFDPTPENGGFASSNGRSLCSISTSEHLMGVLSVVSASSWKSIASPPTSLVEFSPDASFANVGTSSPHFVLCCQHTQTFQAPVESAKDLLLLCCSQHPYLVISPWSRMYNPRRVYRCPLHLVLEYQLRLPFLMQQLESKHGMEYESSKAFEPMSHQKDPRLIHDSYWSRIC
ncbi:hypothetical protein ACJIZ3_007864 [Penstemon smallii]|uniref:Uncharacterized protein n=1 Tax=Penstemon smallii TaxID=265156 RepID=A0ABD3T9M6_9LAMI